MRWILTSFMAAMLAVTAGCGSSSEAPAEPNAATEASAPADASAPTEATAEPAVADGEAEKASGGPQKLDDSKYKAITKGVKYAVLKSGSGEKATGHRQVVVHYTGWLEDGTKFDSSVDRGEPFAFELGSGMVIQGWEIGVEGMQVGEKRQLVIPAEAGYGEQGAAPVIPPNATLIFEVELLSMGEAHVH